MIGEVAAFEEEDSSQRVQEDDAHGNACLSWAQQRNLAYLPLEADDWAWRPSVTKRLAYPSASSIAL